MDVLQTLSTLWALASAIGRVLEFFAIPRPRFYFRSEAHGPSEDERLGGSLWCMGSDSTIKDTMPWAGGAEPECDFRLSPVQRKQASKHNYPLRPPFPTLLATGVFG